MSALVPCGTGRLPQAPVIGVGVGLGMTVYGRFQE